MAGSNNFTIHNPTNANQQTDGTFAGDSLTTGGIGVDAIMPSNWMNARWYEDSVGFWALAEALKNKGYVVSKDNPATLAAVLANILTNNDVKPPLISVAYSPTPLFNAALANGFDMVLGGNVTGATLSGFTIGQTLTFIVTQGSTPFTFAAPAGVNGWEPINQVPNSITIQQFIVKEDGSIWPIGIQTTPTVIRNSNGVFVTTPDGVGGFIYEAWGTVNAPASGSRTTGVNITFPAAFPGTPSLVVSGALPPSGTNADGMTCYVFSSNAASAVVTLECVVNIGGTGAPGFNNSVPVNWHARY